MGTLKILFSSSIPLDRPASQRVLCTRLLDISWELLRLENTSLISMIPTSSSVVVMWDGLLAIHTSFTLLFSSVLQRLFSRELLLILTSRDTGMLLRSTRSLNSTLLLLR